MTLETNAAYHYGADSVMGMTITKEIIPTKADVSATDLSKFLVVHQGEFVFNPRTHGKHIGLGFNDSGNSFIISWNNIAFRVKESMRDTVLSEYLFLHFNRDEWDREACYRSWGSSTEVFSWDALCEMELLLPSLAIQQKYVDVYQAMLANQRSYERGLDDLKLTIDAIMDNFKYTEQRMPVGALLEDVDERNADGVYASAQGINITKQFMDSVASSKDLLRYKIVRNNQFAYSPMQTGRDECIRIALNQGKNPIIVSPAYSVLKKKYGGILEEYVQMWFSRKESDRLGWFMSDASIRASLDLQRFFEIEIPVPSFGKQLSLVDIYKAYMLRREINEKLKAQIRDICPILIKGSIEEAEAGRNRL